MPSPEPPPPDDVTQLLERLGLGEHDASESLLELVYERLRSIAGHRMAGERADHTLDATALVHEAWLRLIDQDTLSWSSRRHFYGAAAGAMRRILVEHARHRGRQKRGGTFRRLDLEVADLGLELDPSDVLAVEESLTSLERVDTRAAEIVKLRFFAGLDVAEIAGSLQLSVRTIRREWVTARAYLLRTLGP